MDETPIASGENNIAAPQSPPSELNQSEVIIDIPSIEPPAEILITCHWCSIEEIHNCLKCSRPFCSLHSSRFSPAFCQECFQKLSLVVDKFTKTIEDYDTVNDTIVIHKQECDRLRLDGTDWVWFTKWINTLNDEDLKVVYEFHYFVLKLIEQANEVRKTERSHKLKGKKIASGITTTTEVKTRRVAKSVDLGTMLRKQFPNLAQDIIDKMVEAAKNGA